MIGRDLALRLDVIEARLDDLVGMLGEVFDQLHPCQDCIDDRDEVRTTSDERTVSFTARPGGSNIIIR